MGYFRLGPRPRGDDGLGALVGGGISGLLNRQQVCNQLRILQV